MVPSWSCAGAHSASGSITRQSGFLLWGHNSKGLSLGTVLPDRMLAFELGLAALRFIPTKRHRRDVSLLAVRSGRITCSPLKGVFDRNTLSVLEGRCP
jgi:hypothetical protein